MVLVFLSLCLHPVVEPSSFKLISPLAPQVEFLPLDELEAEVSRLPSLADADEELTKALADILHPWARKVGRNKCFYTYLLLILK